MPIYEFECPTCNERFDRLQKLSDPDPQNCPECGAAGVRRRVTAPAFRLAGSGWYETDFKKDGDKKRNLADKGGAEKGAEKGDATKADAKPAETAAAKTETKPSESAAKPPKSEKPAPAAN
jgi:putative FmdB family regulatory protein